MPTQPKKSSTKKTKTGKTKVKPISNVGGGQGGILTTVGQASGQVR